MIFMGRINGFTRSRLGSVWLFHHLLILRRRTRSHGFIAGLCNAGTFSSTAGDNIRCVLHIKKFLSLMGLH